MKNFAALDAASLRSRFPVPKSDKAPPDLKKPHKDLEGQFLDRWRLLFPDIKLEEQHRFHDTRKWRFDFAHEASKVGIEIEGGIWTGGAHTRGKHYESDCHKYNAAAALGWTVFRLTTDMTQDSEQLLQIAVTIRNRA